MTPWFIWSGRLPSDGDEEAAVNALVQTGMWRFHGEGELDEIEDEARAIELLTWLFGHRLAGHGLSELMPTARASELAGRFVSLLPDRRRWFGNDWDGPPGPPDYISQSNPMTHATFDAGVVAVADGRAWIAWFTDED
jgi:hypothetical protein